MNEADREGAPAEETLTAHLMAELDLRRSHALLALGKVGIELPATPSEASRTGSSARSSYLLELWDAAETAIARRGTALKQKEQRAADVAAQHLLAVGLAFRAWEEGSERAASSEALAALVLAGIRLGEIGLPQTRAMRVPRPTAKRGRGRTLDLQLHKQDEAALRQFFRCVFNGSSEPFAGMSESDAWDEVCPPRDGLTRRKRLQERLGTYLPLRAPKSNNLGSVLKARRLALRKARLALAEEVSRR